MNWAALLEEWVERDMGSIYVDQLFPASWGNAPIWLTRQLFEGHENPLASFPIFIPLLYELKGSEIFTYLID